MSRIKDFLRLVVRLTRPLVWKVASVYGFALNRPAYAQGDYDLVIEGGANQIRHQIPTSCYFNTRCGDISIGVGTVFGEGVSLLTGKHVNISQSEETGQALNSIHGIGCDIKIGRGCYVGTNAILIGPLEIGDHVVIGAGSVVTKSFGSRLFIAGNPARVISNI